MRFAPPSTAFRSFSTFTFTFTFTISINDPLEPAKGELIGVRGKLDPTS
jgi:hypothetical protein